VDRLTLTLGEGENIEMTVPKELDLAAALQFDDSDWDALERIIDKLGEYEDTGLSPIQIKENSKRLERLEYANRWVSVTESLPDVRNIVLIYLAENMEIYSGYLGDSGEWYILDGRLKDVAVSTRCKVTHWRRLPAAPETL